MPNSLSQLDERARQVMRNASQSALNLGHTEIEPGHVLLGILDEGTGITASCLRLIDRDFGLVRKELKNRMHPRMDMNSFGRLPHSRTTTQVLEHASYEAVQSGVSLLSPAHLILGILRVPGTVAYATLEHLGVQIDDVREDIMNELRQLPNQENAG